MTTNWQRIEAMEDNLMTLLFDMGYTIEVQPLGVQWGDPVRSEEQVLHKFAIQNALWWT